ncbi:MAG: sodium/solute symporter [Oscillospiraceae bacterium]|jgi:SSS family transporter|nr:sodium/solute symporter [Oscillospiraceae bacterium]MDD3260817.1 sodium/solute symporter [Oscillospiraceae bacterium]
MGTFGVLNWVVLLGYFVAMMIMGKKIGKSNNSTEAYFLGSRKIPWWAIGLSAMATQCSAVSFIGMPGWGYTSGLKRLTFTFQFPIVMLIIMATFVPFFYHTKVVSIYEYLEKRFGKKSRGFMAFIFLLSRGLQTAIVMFAPALALSMITGIDPKITILIMGGVSIAYTVLGGITAVIWTDVVQMFIIWGGILLAILFPLLHSGGFSTVLANAQANHFLTRLDYSFDINNQYSFWGGLLGSGFLYLAYFGTDQSQVQRLLTAKSVRETKMSMALCGFIVPIQTLLFLCAGINLFTAFGGKHFANSDYVMLTFITKYLPAGIAGLVTAGVFAAGMSSVSSALNSLATVTVSDFYKKWKPQADDRQCLRVSRFATFFWGLFCTVFALLLGGLGTVLDLINVIGPMFYPCMLSAFILAVFCKRGNEKGCLAAILTGLVVDIYMFRFTSIGSLWWSFFGTIVAVAVGYLVSVLTSKKEEKTEKEQQKDLENFDFTTATGSALTIHNITKLAVAGKIAEKDKEGYYVIPGKIDKIGYGLIAFFVVQCIILSII